MPSTCRWTEAGSTPTTRAMAPAAGSAGRYARIDLVVQVPAGTNLRVDDSSGSIEITGVGESVAPSESTAGARGASRFAM